MIAKPAAMPGICGARKARPPASSVNSSSGHRRLSRIALGMVLGQRGARLGARRAGARSAGWSRRAGRGAGRSARRPPTSRRRSAASVCSELGAGGEHGDDAPSAVAAPALSSTVVLRKSTKRTRVYSSASSSPRTPLGAVDRQVGLARQLGRRFVGADRHAERALAASPDCDERAQAAEGVEVGGVVADVQRRASTGAPRSSVGDAEALVERDRRAHLEHLAAPVHGEALAPRRARRSPAPPRSAASSSGAPRQWKAAIASLSSLRTRSALVLGRVGARGELAHARRPRRELGVDLGAGRAGAQQLAAVVADVGDRADRDDLARGRGAAAADAADDAGSAWRSRSAACAWPRARARRRRGGRSARACRRCRAGPPRGRDRSGAARAPPRAWQRGTRRLVWRAWWPTRPLARVLAERASSATAPLKLVAIGTAAGLFSGLFGVGGGSVIVPLLVLWLGYERARGDRTSLAAIVFIAGFAAAVQGAVRQRARARRGARRGAGGRRRADRHVAAAAPARPRRSRCCSPPCWWPAPSSWCCGDRRDRDRRSPAA